MAVIEETKKLRKEDPTPGKDTTTWQQLCSTAHIFRVSITDRAQGGLFSQGKKIARSPVVFRDVFTSAEDQRSGQTILTATSQKGEKLSVACEHHRDGTEQFTGTLQGKELSPINARALWRILDRASKRMERTNCVADPELGPIQRTLRDSLRN